MIPKIIHCCWFGPKPISDQAKQYIKQWKTLNPDYEIIIWNENNFDYSSNRYATEAYGEGKWAFVTDYVRLKVLYDYGGIYMDTDVEALKPFDSILNCKAFSGFESDDRIPTGTMGAEPHNPWIKLLLDDYSSRSFYKADGSVDLTTNVSRITELTKQNYPIKLDNTLQDFGDFVIFPFDYFCAKNINDGIVYATENTITIHHFAGSWTSGKKKLISFLRNHFGNGFVQFLVKIKRLFRR